MKFLYVIKSIQCLRKGEKTLALEVNMHVAVPENAFGPHLIKTLVLGEALAITLFFCGTNSKKKARNAVF
jgi:hypothetical protein